MPSLIRTTVLIPIADNQGIVFDAETWAWVLAKGLRLFGGLTFEGTVTGQWIEDGTIYADESRRYTISLTSWEQMPQWLAFIQALRVRFRQIALYGEVAGIPEIFRGTG